MKKVLILTRTSTRNFGTVLQAYALQQSIQSLGYCVWVLDDNNIRKEYNKCERSTVETQKKSFKEIIYDYIDSIRLRRMYARENKIDKQVGCFKKKYVKYYVTDKVETLEHQFDIFVSGSDQIWAEAAEPQLYSFFMQDFVGKKKTKISYAVSIGEKGFSPQLEEKIIGLVNDFNKLSVREKSSYDALCPYVLNHEISIVCDPVFHINAKKWSEIAGKRIRKGKYLFCYILSSNEWYFQKIKELEKLFECEIIIYCNQKIKNKDGVVLQTCNPKSFLNYIQYADFVLTDSYHAMLFSLIFQKNFCVLQRFNSGGTNTQNGRIEYVLNFVGLEDKLIDDSESVNTRMIDYKSVYKQINAFRQHSMNYLQNALKYEEIDDGKELDNSH